MSWTGLDTLTHQGDLRPAQAAQRSDREGFSGVIMDELQLRHEALQRDNQALLDQCRKLRRQLKAQRVKAAELQDKLDAMTGNLAASA